MSMLLPLPVEAPDGSPMVIHVGLVVGPYGLMLIDCGNPGFWPNIQKAISAKGFDAQSLTHVLITHHDKDHIGSLHDVVTSCPGIKVLASESDTPRIEGRMKSLRLLDFEQIRKTLPPFLREAHSERIRNLSDIRPVKVNRLVYDGDKLDAFPGLRIVSMPGHMPGHMAVYEETDQCAFVGDGLLAMDGQLMPPSPDYTLDMDTALSSVAKLAQLPLRMIICAHGGVVTKDVREQLLSIAALA